MFYTFTQNNSGGSFILDEEDGITHNVIVEANSKKQAISIAEGIGLYFDGEGDCECCGTRWSDYSPEEAESPSVYGVHPAKSSSYKWMDEGKETVVHFLDGRKEWY